MKDISVDIKDVLEDESELGLQFGDNLFIGRLPSKPDNCVVLFTNPSAPPDVALDAATINNDSFQMYVRNTSYQEAMEIAYQVIEVLHVRNRFEVNESFYLFVKETSNPFLFEWDDNNRVILIVNFETKRRRI